MLPMFLSKWKNQQVPDFDGIICRSGTAYKFRDSGIRKIKTLPNIIYFENVAILAKQNISDELCIVCGEAFGHGSIGVVVLENTRDKMPVWTMLSRNSNPFDQIQKKGGYYIVISTSASIFRFRLPLENVTLSIP